MLSIFIMEYYNSTILNNLNKYKAMGVVKQDAKIIVDCYNQVCIGQEDILLPIYSPADFAPSFYLYLND